MATRLEKVALITGASSGIGLELTHRFAQGGYDVVLVARGVQRLEALAREVEAQHGVKTLVVAADLADGAAPRRVVDAVQAAGWRVDVLVNNAGFAAFGAFAGETALEDEVQMVQVNVLALTVLTKLLVPGMVARRSGRILNVASTAAFQPGPLMAVYYATKAYVLSFSEALSNELAGTGVTVTALCPGPTKTGFQARAKMEESKLVKDRAIMDSATVARVGYDALHRGRKVVVPGLLNKVMAGSVRFMPRGVVTSVVRSVQERAKA